MTSSFSEKIIKLKNALDNIYVKKSSTTGLLKNDGTVDTNTYLTQHQDISGKVNSSDLSTVAISGSYNDLNDKPSIPTDVSDLTDTSNTTFTPKSHSHELTDVTDTSTVEVVVTYTDSSTDTLNLVVYDED